MIYPSTFEEKIGMVEVRQMLKQQCLSTLGKERVDEMSFLTHGPRIRTLHQQVGEYTRLEAEMEDIPSQGFFDMRPMLRRIRVEGIYMEVDEMWNLKRALDTIEAIVRLLHNDEHPYPALKALTDGIETFPAVSKRVNAILDKFGQVKDSASPELAKIRADLARTEGSVGRILNSLLRSAQQEGLVSSDVTPTMRDGRLVIPVAPALKRKIKGIVHDESATGKTVFIEPQEVVEANNRIRELEHDERREVIRILQEFTSLVRPLAPQMLQSFEFLADIEFIRAKAHFARQIDAFTTVEPQIADHPHIDWTLAIHPLLRLTLARHGKRVVPLDIKLSRRERILIISGPNAGGKSVCLKTVGLLQYMLQCGLPVTLGEHSRLGIFNHLMIDIGDEQSIEDELSTYSSHLLNMKKMMQQADPATLLLIDEFGGGTEPQIGGAMAEAVLGRFVRQGAFAVITTHYQNLKLYADRTDGVVNGAMLYDRHLMQALFRLEIGNPGSSFAVEIARKIGIPEDVITEASNIVGREYIDADKWLQDIVRDKRYWETKRQNIHAQEKQMAQAVERYETEMADLQRQRKEIIKAAKEKAEQLLAEANARIENTIREIREAQAEKERTRNIRQQFEEFRDEVNDVEQQQEKDDAIARKMKQLQERKERQQRRKNERAQQAATGSTTPSSAETQTTRPLATGDTVRIKGQTSIGTIESIKGGQATVIFGLMRTNVQLNRLQRATQPAKADTPTDATFLSRQTRDLMRERSLHFNQDIDVRGMRGDEALNAVTHFIDDAIQVGMSRVRILHGTGTGILRTLIRQYLNTVPSVTSARDEHVQFGGAGITVVDLK